MAVLFSGGLDSMVLAALAHLHAPSEEPIDLLNVCFDPKHQSPDRLTAAAGLLELQAAFPSRYVVGVCTLQHESRAQYSCCTSNPKPNQPMASVSHQHTL